MGNAQHMAKSIIFIVAGTLLSSPFIIDTFIMGHEYHYIELWPMLFLVGLIVGGPLLLAGILLLFVRGNINTSASTLDTDIARIRFSIETDSRRK